MIALCLQTYPGDTEVAMDLVKLICEIEPSPRDTEFVLVYRKDCDPRLPQFFEQLAGHRFKAYARLARNHEVGWPGGSNMLAQSAFMEMSILNQLQLVSSDGFLLFEPDCIPLQIGWIDLLSAEWETTKSLGKEAFGHWGPPELHMNGNAVFSTTFFDRHSNIMIGPATQGWDFFYREHYIPISRDSDLILSHWQRYNLDQGAWDTIAKNGTRPALLHGVKTEDGRACARANLLCVNG
jgi:hypothetical protein